MKQLIYNSQGKERLDKFLVEQLPDLSRSQLQQAIKNGEVKINSRTVAVHHFLKTGDIISLDLKKEKEIESKAIIEPEKIGQTADYLVINKPAGLVVHPAEGTRVKTLTDWLIKKFPKIKNVGDNTDRPGIVHRLDKEVSGLMVVALNQKMFEHLKNQFQERKTKKQYLGLVYGIIDKDVGINDFPLSRSEVTGKMVAKPQNQLGKEAITNFSVISRYSRYTYLSLEILTGRTHQIRVHLQAYGYPLVGDRLYFNKKIKNNLQLDRIFLHACFLGFNDLNNEWQEFKCDLPDDLNNILIKLK